MTDEERKDPDPTNSDPLEFLNREDDDPVEPDETDELEELDEPAEPAQLPPDPDDEDVDIPVGEAPVAEPAAPDEPAQPVDAPQGAVVPPVTAVRRSGNGRGAGGMSRIMIGAGVVIVALALMIFWPRGGGLPEEEGDFTSVVTLPDTAATAAVPAPRSSEVDLDQELQEVVPEKPEYGAATPEGTRASLRQEVDVRKDDAPDLADPGSPVTQGTAAISGEHPVIDDGSPTNVGKWAIQMGAFRTSGRASTVVDDLAGKGFRSEVVSLPSSSGGTSYKVWIGYFDTRAAATAYARSHRDELGTDTFITHR